MCVYIYLFLVLYCFGAMAEEVVFTAIYFRQKAEKYMNENSPGKSFNYYLLSLQFMPQWKNELRNSLVSVLCKLIHLNSVKNRI